jgi:hypothetical protein
MLRTGRGPECTVSRKPSLVSREWNQAYLVQNCAKNAIQTRKFGKSVLPIASFELPVRTKYRSKARANAWSRESRIQQKVRGPTNPAVEVWKFQKFQNRVFVLKRPGQGSPIQTVSAFTSVAGYAGPPLPFRPLQKARTTVRGSEWGPVSAWPHQGCWFAGWEKTLAVWEHPETGWKHYLFT